MKLSSTPSVTVNQDHSNTLVHAFIYVKPEAKINLCDFIIVLLIIYP